MTAARSDGRATGPRVAYIMSRFPKLTETFILQEMLYVERHGVDVELYPLIRETGDVVQPEAVALVKRAHYLPYVSTAIVRSQLHFLRRSPRAYLGTLWAIVRGTWGSRNFLIRGLAIFPKVAHSARLMESSGIDHVHCHFASHPALAGFIVRRLVGIPFSFTAHGSDLHVDRHMLSSKVAEASFVVTISEYNRQLIRSECGDQWDSKVQVIHCGVDTGRFEPVDRSTRTDPLRIVCVGTLHEVKGQTYLIEACRLLANAGVSFTCHLVGTGPDEPALRRQIESADLADRVELVGALQGAQIAAMLRTADVLVTPSVPTESGQREGIPVVLMEAMSSGLPVIASRLSGIPELVDDEVSGLLVPPRDGTALAGALQRLHQDRSLRERLGGAGREKVRAEFDASANAARLANRFRAQLQVK